MFDYCTSEILDNDACELAVSGEDTAFLQNCRFSEHFDAFIAFMALFFGFLLNLATYSRKKGASTHHDR